MKGRKGSRTEWSVYWRESERCWVTKYYDPKGRRHEARIPRDVASSSEDQSGAEKFARRWLKSYVSSYDTSAVNEPASQNLVEVPSVAILFKKWLDLREAKYKAQSMSYSALKQDRGMWRNHLQLRVGSIGIDAFDHTWIRKILIAHRGAGYGAQSVRNLWSVLKTFFDDVDAEGWWPFAKNPARHKSVTENLPRLPNRSKPTLAVDVAEQLLKCPEVEIHRRIRYLLALLTGLRDGEIAGLKFHDVLVGGTSTIAVNKQLRREERGFKEAPPKTETSRREVPLGTLVIQAIDWWFDKGWSKRVGRKPTRADYIFSSDSGGAWRPRSAELLRSDLYLAGLPTQYRGEIGYVFHRTRGTFSSWLARRGTPYDLRRFLLGHGSIGVTDGSYEEQADRVPDEISKLTLAVTLDDLTTYVAPTRPQQAEARRVAKETANHNVKWRHDGREAAAAGQDGPPKHRRKRTNFTSR